VPISVTTIPVTAPSKVWVYGCSLAGIASSNPATAWMFVSCECCVLSVCHCDGPITCPEESLAPLGAVAPWQKKYIFYSSQRTSVFNGT